MTNRKRPYNDIDGESNVPAKRLRIDNEADEFISQFEASALQTDTATPPAICYDIQLSYIQAKYTGSRLKEDSLLQAILSKAAPIQNQELLVGPRTRYWIVVPCSNMKETTTNLEIHFETSEFTVFKLDTNIVKPPLVLHFKNDINRSVLLTIRSVKESKDTLSVHETHGRLGMNEMVRPSANVFNQPIEAPPIPQFHDDLAVMSKYNERYEINTLTSNLFLRRSRSQKGLLQKQYFALIVFAPISMVHTLSEMLRSQFPYHTSIDRACSLYYEDRRQLHWCVLLACYEEMNFKDIQDYLVPATEIIVFIETEDLNEDICWLKSITNQLDFIEKTHTCTNIPAIDLGNIPQSAQLLVSALKQFRKRKEQLVLGCYLVRPNLEDYTNIAHCARLWIAAPLGLSPEATCFCAEFDAQASAYPYDAAHHLNNANIADGWNTDSQAYAYSSILVLFRAPASYKWFCKYNFGNMKQKLAFHKLELKSISLTNRHHIARLMKNLMNSHFKEKLFDLFCSLKPTKGGYRRFTPPVRLANTMTDAPQTHPESKNIISNDVTLAECTPSPPTPDPNLSSDIVDLNEDPKFEIENRHQRVASYPIHDPEPTFHEIKQHVSDTLFVKPQVDTYPNCASSSERSTNITCVVKVLSAKRAGSRANKEKIMENVVIKGQCFEGELPSRGKSYLAIHPTVGIKDIKVVYKDKEITKQFNTLPTDPEQDLSVPLEKKKLPITLCVHKEHSILCFDLLKTQVKEIVIVCRVPSSPDPKSNEDPGFSKWTLRIKVTSKENSTTTPQKTKTPASDNLLIDESTSNSLSGSDKPVHPTLKVRKVLVLVSSAHPNYFDCIRASLKEQNFEELICRGDIAAFSLRTSNDHAERVIVIKYSLALYRKIETIASGADYILLMVTPQESEKVDKPHVVKQVGDLILTSGIPNEFSVCDAKPLDSLQMLENNIISNLMKSGSTLWLIPNEVNAPIISNALHLTLTSYQLRPCAQDLFTSWIFKGDCTLVDCEQKVTDKLHEIDPHVAQVELACHCCVAVIVRSDMWLWHLIDMMDDSDFASLGPSFKSVRQIDVRDVEKYLKDPKNDFCKDQLVALREHIQDSGNPFIENKMRCDVQNNATVRVQIPLKRSSESIDLVHNDISKKQHIAQPYNPSGHDQDRNQL